MTLIYESISETQSSAGVFLLAREWRRFPIKLRILLISQATFGEDPKAHNDRRNKRRDTLMELLSQACAEMSEKLLAFSIAASRRTTAERESTENEDGTPETRGRLQMFGTCFKQGRWLAARLTSWKSYSSLSVSQAR